MSSKTVFDQLVTSAASELFAARGIDVRIVAGSDVRIEYAATIGFAADGMRGMIGLGMSPDTLQRMSSQDQAPGTTCNSEDWLAESANQLLGRLKNKLLRYGVVLSIALPTVLQGVRLQFLGTGTTTLWTHALDSELGPFWVWLDVRCKEALVLTEVDDPELQGTPEGELLLF
jgi:hypothetical protein